MKTAPGDGLQPHPPFFMYKITDGVHWNPFPAYKKLEDRMVLAVYGARDIGKTYTAKLERMDAFAQAVEDWGITPANEEKAIEEGKLKRFVFMRRQENEVIQTRRAFFSKYPADIQKDWRVTPGNVIKYKGLTAGYLMSLYNIRSAGFEVNGIKYIIFDEFISHKTGARAYLKDEYTVLMSAVDTLIREDDGVRLVMLANNITAYNPYFLEWEYVPNNSHFWEPKTGRLSQVLIERCETNPVLLERRKETHFGRLIEGTVYGDMSLENKSLRDNEDFIKKKSRYCTLPFALVIDRRTYGVWVDKYSPECFISEGVGNGAPITYAMDDESRIPGVLARRELYASGHWQSLLSRYGRGYLFFETQRAKSAFFNGLRASL